MPMKDRTSWSNWAGNQVCAPVAIRSPTTEAELVGIVVDAASRRRPGEVRRRRALVHGHRLHRRRPRRPVRATAGCSRHDAEARTVTVQAGITLSALCDELDRRGLALENMGDIAYQSIAGATATATHGTGWHFGNISSRIVGMRLITGDGSIVEATADRERRRARRRPGSASARSASCRP